MTVLNRRGLMAGAAASIGVLSLRPARASEIGEMDRAIADFLAGRTAKPGRVSFDAPPLVENGNSVPLKIMVESPMKPGDHVKRIVVFNEKNPQPNVAVFHLGPHNGRAEVSTRIRLATSQFLVAAAEMNDGSVHMERVEVIVTIAACTED